MDKQPHSPLLSSGDPYASGVYAEAHPRWHEEDGAHKARAIAPWIAELRPRTVIDVGCGTGGVIGALAEVYPHIAFEGWDPAPYPIAIAERLGRPCRRGDALVQGRTADLVLALDVIEHVADDTGFLRALLTLAPRAIFRIPIDLSVRDLIAPGRLRALARDQDHRHLYTRELAEDRLTATGWTVEESRYDRVPGPVGRLDPFRRWAQRIAPHLGVRWLGGASWLVLAMRSFDADEPVTMR